PMPEGKGLQAQDLISDRISSSAYQVGVVVQWPRPLALSGTLSGRCGIAQRMDFLGERTRTMSTEKATRSRGRWAFGAIAALWIVAVGAGTFLYNFFTAYFAVNGTWYGPMKLQVGPTTVTLQAYVDLSTHLNGDLVGTGSICSKTPVTNAISTVATG